MIKCNHLNKEKKWLNYSIITTIITLKHIFNGFRFCCWIIYKNKNINSKHFLETLKKVFFYTVQSRNFIGGQYEKECRSGRQ